MILPVLSISFVFYSVQSKLVFDTVQIRTRVSAAGIPVSYTDETSASSKLGVNILTSTVYTTDRPTKTPVAFIQDENRDSSCVNTICPDLIRIHTFYNSSNTVFNTRFVAHVAGASEPNDDSFGIAGYLAPTPGYCGATDKQLVEFVSDNGVYTYDAEGSIAAYSTVDQTKYSDPRFQVNYKFMGYYYAVGNDQDLPGTAPNYTVPAFQGRPKSYVYPLQEIVRFDAVDSQKKAFVGTLTNIKLYSSWSNFTYVKTTSIRLLKHTGDLGLMAKKCGSVQVPLLEMRDPSGNFRLSTVATAPLKTVGIAGYVFKTQSTICGATIPLSEYQLKSDPTVFAVSTSDDATYSSDSAWQSLQTLGYILPSDKYYLSVV